MPSPHSLTRPQRERLNERVLQLFIEFCRLYFGFTLYDYQVEVARELLSSIFVCAGSRVPRASRRRRTWTG
jgi:hypothetical protein